jgi:hypothetical protein
MSVGFLAELFTAYYQRDAAAYSIKERVGNAAHTQAATTEAATADESHP